MPGDKTVCTADKDGKGSQMVKMREKEKWKRMKEELKTLKWFF